MPHARDAEYLSDPPHAASDDTSAATEPLARCCVVSGVVLPSVVAVMLAVGLLAALGPARRGLAVQPTEALRDE